jgi:hypothetical protein
MVSAGEVVGAMAEMDCERVSSGERTLWRRPEPEGGASSGVRTSSGMGGSVGWWSDGWIIRRVSQDWAKRITEYTEKKREHREDER